MPQGLLPFSAEHPHRRILDNTPGCFSRTKRRCFSGMNGRRRLLKMIIIGLLTVCSVLYLLFFFSVNNYSKLIEEEQPDVAVAEALIDKRVDFRAVTIDKMCSQISDVCYSIIDKKTETGDVERNLLFDNGRPDESDTIVVLIPPKSKSFETSDTRIWNVNHTRLTSQYVAGMLIAPFMVGVFSPNNNNDGSSLLEIGLGGGSLDMALHIAKPKLNITVIELDSTIVQISEKWFGVINDDYRRTITADGVEYIRSLRKSNETVDVIVLDACDGDRDFPCPAKSFREKEAVENMKAVLKHNGVLVVNYLSHKEDIHQSYLPFTEVFPTCLQLKMIIEVNNILVCLPYTIGDVEEQLKFFDNRLATSISALDLQYILDNVSISKL